MILYISVVSDVMSSISFIMNDISVVSRGVCMYAFFRGAWCTGHKVGGQWELLGA